MNSRGEAVAGEGCFVEGEGGKGAMNSCLWMIISSVATRASSVWVWLMYCL